MLLKAKIYEEKMKGENNENKKNIQNLFRSEITRKPKMNIYYFMDLIIRALNLSVDLVLIDLIVEKTV